MLISATVAPLLKFTQLTLWWVWKIKI